MNYATLTLGLVFLVLGMVFRTNVVAPEPALAANKRLASILLFVASAAFFFAFAISAFNSGAA